MTILSLNANTSLLGLPQMPSHLNDAEMRSGIPPMLADYRQHSRHIPRSALLFPVSQLSEGNCREEMK